MAGDTKIVPWRVEQDERESVTLTVVDAEGVVFPADGWTITATIKTGRGGTLLYTFPPGDVVFDSDENTITLTIPAPVSAEWEFTQGWYSVTIQDPASGSTNPDRQRVLAGPLVIDAD